MTMTRPVSLTMDPKSGRLFALYSDGSVEAITLRTEPYHAEPEWERIAPPNPRADEESDAEVQSPDADRAGEVQMENAFGEG